MEVGLPEGPLGGVCRGVQVGGAFLVLGGAAWKPLSAAGGGGVSVALWKAELQLSDDLMDVLKKKSESNSYPEV